ncbi:DNA polymerase III subunit delta' [Haematospirillum jordaniae]|uniref:DNA polymerase III subunit delta' n=1 Tax=Haematospirillum jordaniae TaxID=1549855 RepID=UPI0009ED1769|nr:DNA polymerase III subunit delta' [Haematospirillum jordaniae]NKD45651.1 DNA polymerase III subunit delta' [Haematospirillum jordaniae]NKD56404.1 DNA polymerase III subunit delta' [Haematospirillum jordaniae]NKD58462.1 DNA polymerase III subunit delta' [Haematospirillum jordaniae]NKD66369.1 DNA polymerase III subunit delta' [Haematospirillum jordaniae]NKD78464.1 DNA polymerase III subunit delta' [Haematospirillum jordaniae]
MTALPSLLSPRQHTAFIGHKDAEQAFLQAWNQGRMHHAWLFSGMRGIGKATLAMRIARFVLSDRAAVGATTLAVSEDDPVCSRIAQDTHGDFRVLERTWDEKRKRLKGDIPVDDIRALGEWLSMTSSRGGWRVVLVDTADDMNRNSANALLKILEEPPQRTLFLVLSHFPGRLLPTLRSRCRHVPMRPLSEAQCQELMGRYTVSSLDVETRRILVQLGEGSVGQALDLASQGGVEHYQALMRILRDVLEGSPNLPALYTFADTISRTEDVFRLSTDLMLWWLGRAIRYAGRKIECPGIVQDDASLARIVLAAAPLDQLIEVWEKVRALFERAEAVHLDRKQVFISAVLSLQALVRSVPQTVCSVR